METMRFAAFLLAGSFVAATVTAANSIVDVPAGELGSTEEAGDWNRRDGAFPLQRPRTTLDRLKREYELTSGEGDSAEAPPVDRRHHCEHDEWYDPRCIKSVTMRDGVGLHIETEFGEHLVLPQKSVPLLDISPYGNLELETYSSIGAPYGFLPFGVDERGTSASNGTWEFMQSTGKDVQDLTAWFVNQTWVDRPEVYTVGGSADGVLQFEAWQEPQPYLKKQFIIWASADPFLSFYRNGAYRKSLVEGWINATIAPHMKDHCEDCIHHAQASEAPDSMLWTNLNVLDRVANITSETVMWAGWYDIFIDQQIEAFNKIQEESATAGKHWLVVEPVGHSSLCNQDLKKYWKTNLHRGRANLPIELAVNMFLDRPVSAQGVKKITFYVMGPNPNQPGQSTYGNYWTTMDTWPVHRPNPFYLTSEGGLANVRPASNDAVSYKYDPTDPIRTLGGANLFPLTDTNGVPSCGPLDQSPLHNQGRKDYLMFTSNALEEPIAVTGDVKVLIWVSSNCTDTDFMVKLMDKYEDGRAIILKDNAVRMRWRNCFGDPHGCNGNPRPELMTPGARYLVEMSLGWTSYIFNVGHRIEVDISSSNYPRFGLNHNAPNATVLEPGTPEVAENNIFVGGSFASALILPQVDLQAINPFQLNPRGRPLLPFPPFHPHNATMDSHEFMTERIRRRITGQ